MRYGADLKTPIAGIHGPKVMLIDETAGSGGDLLPWMFRKFQLGPLVGKRTWGGLVGILGFPVLMDGGQVTAPNLAIWTEDGFVVENEGVPPDVEVEQTPGRRDRRQGPAAREGDRDRPRRACEEPAGHAEAAAVSGEGAAGREVKAAPFAPRPSGVATAGESAEADPRAGRDAGQGVDSARRSGGMTCLRWAVALALLALAPVASAQGLGDAAKKEKQRREQGQTTAAKTYTQEELAKLPPVSAPAAAPAGAPSPASGVSTPAASGSTARTDAGGDARREEGQWRARVAAAQARVDQARASGTRSSPA